MCEGCYAILPLIHDWFFKMNVPGVTSVVKLLWKGFSNKNTYSIGFFQHLFVWTNAFWKSVVLMFLCSSNFVRIKPNTSFCPKFQKRLFPDKWYFKNSSFWHFNSRLQQKHQWLRFHYCDYLTDFWHNNWRSILR